MVLVKRTNTVLQFGKGSYLPAYVCILVSGLVTFPIILSSYFLIITQTSVSYGR
jgi:hypothetical protein